MSRENVELVRRIYEWFLQGEIEQALAVLDPEIEWREPPESPGAGVYHGHDGVRRSYASWTGNWADYRLEVEELIDAGDAVMARCRQRVRAKTSGVEIEQPLFGAWSLRDGTVVRMRMYHDEHEALEAAGLRE
jgi:ketosteroid isomerase-like protein